MPLLSNSTLELVTGASSSPSATITLSNIFGTAVPFFADAFGLTSETSITSASVTGFYSLFITPGVYYINDSSGTPAVGTALIQVNAHDLAVSGLVTAARLASETDKTPTVSAGAGAGTPGAGPAISGTDMAGIVSITPGTAVINDPLMVITFGHAYAAAPKAVIITPANQATAALAVADTCFVSPITATSFTIKTNSTITGLSSTAVAWYYVVLG